MTEEREPIDQLADELFAAARREQPEGRVRARAKHLALASRAGINAVQARGPVAYAPLFAVAIVVAALAFVAAGALRKQEAAETIAITPEVVERETVEHDHAAKPAREKSPAVARTEQRTEVIQAKPRSIAKPAQPKSAPRPQPSLAEEIALLDQARSALTAGESTLVIALVDRYEGELGGTRMRAEAALLRIEALAQSGQDGRAAQLARRFVQQHAGNPLAERARTLAKIEEHSEEPE
jgi:hypothetical protein